MNKCTAITIMPDRKDLEYRYAYQGQEKDPETGMEAFELRLWDGRIGRWLNPDPKGQYASPYLGMGNNPISSIDPDGGSTEVEPPVNGINTYSDETGIYFWNKNSQEYDHYSKGILPAYIGSYVANEFSKPVGEYSIQLDAVTEEFNPDHSINSLVGILTYAVGGIDEAKVMTDQVKYPGVKIYSFKRMNGAVTLGNVIFTNPTQELDTDIVHEYGHFLDFKYHFNYDQTAYLKEMGIPSIISATISTITGSEHLDSDSEIRADMLGGSYHNIKLYPHPKPPTN